MTDFIRLAKGKLNDPILMEWALDRYRNVETGAQKYRETMEHAWFDDLTLRRWLDSNDQDILTGLFSQLPAERFANLGQAVGERIRKRKSEQQARRAAFERGEWFQDSLNLALRCAGCGEVNEYRVRQIAVNPAEPGSHLLLAHEFACASCGAWADFEFTTEAKLAVTAELIKLAADSDAGLAEKSKVLTRAVAPLNGRVLPVGEVVSHCQAAVAQHPGRIGDWVRLAFCYHQVLSRPRFGVQYTERALSLEANAVEAVILQADALTVEGQDAQAFERLDQALATKELWRFFLTDVSPPAGVAAQFARIYNEMRRQLGRTDRASLHASFRGVSKKVGRNDLCPCGSGKKYKKCCLGIS